jgi:hypothetical protein
MTADMHSLLTMMGGGTKPHGPRPERAAGEHVGYGDRQVPQSTGPPIQKNS